MRISFAGLNEVDRLMGAAPVASEWRSGDIRGRSEREETALSQEPESGTMHFHIKSQEQISGVK
jgi:hypothetical protein